jgi:DNA polymerase-1
MAEEAQDDALRDAVLSADVHTATAATCLNKDPKDVTPDERRNIGKVMNFQIIYGATEHGIAKVMKCDLMKAMAYQHNFFAKYHKTKEWMDKTTESVKEKGYVTIRSGFRKYFPGHPYLSDHDIRSAINLPIQGLAGHILFWALIGCQAFLDANQCKSFLSLEIHDSIVANIHKTEMAILPELKQIMETYFLKFITFKIPIEVDVKMGESLGTLKDYKC